MLDGRRRLKLRVSEEEVGEGWSKDGEGEVVKMVDVGRSQAVREKGEKARQQEFSKWEKRGKRGNGGRLTSMITGSSSSSSSSISSLEISITS